MPSGLEPDTAKYARPDARAMRVLKKDPKEGEIKLRLESMDDVWHLHNLVVPGELVRAVTYRREEAVADKIRPERMEKRRVYLGIRVQDVEFHPFTDRLRISGVIEEGEMDLGQHHTLNLTVGDDLAIVKMWKPHELQRIEEAVAATNRPRIACLAIDDEEALLAHVMQYGVREVAVIKSGRQGKMFPGGRTKADYFEEVLGKLRLADLGDALLVLGPGFEKDDFAAYVREKAPEIGAKMLVHGTSQGGKTGITEALKGGAGAKVLEESRVGVETLAVEKVLEEIAKGGKFAYGPEVDSLAESGAVETLLITDLAVRTESGERVMRAVDQGRGKVVVVSTHHDAGKKLKALGGVAAILRYKVA
ncbi:MAG TPA: mRNA surveillance protein pelota [Thermoplasmata archaeon]|nr:mRNA surveillance protein pelota [Thermoplasmata archaeon]